MQKSGGEAIQMNIFTAVLASLKGLVEAKAKFGQEDVKKAALKLILGETIILDIKKVSSGLGFWNLEISLYVLNMYLISYKNLN